MIKRQSINTMVFAAAALAAGSGWAQMPGGPRGPEGMSPDGMGTMRGYERLHKQLNLTPQQEALWQKARDAQRESFKAMHTKGEETRAKLRAEIDKPGADLKQFAQLGDQMRAQMHEQMEAAHKQVRAAWFGVYDALDAKQKEQVRVAIRDGMDHGGRMGRQHHGGRQGDSGSEHGHG
jgi:protein CpxP